MAMASGDHDIYASAPMRTLLAREAAVVEGDMKRCIGPHALQISAVAGDVSSRPPIAGCWARLYVADARYAGDLRGRVDEPLPFADDVFGLVLLRHALEASPLAQELLREAVRVLAPGGLLVLTGVHPASGWLPWLLWRRRGQMVTLNARLQLGRWLHEANMDLERSQRVGAFWPTRDVRHDRWLGGGFVLVACKRRNVGLPLRLRPRAVAGRVGGLVPTARSSSAP